MLYIMPVVLTGYPVPGVTGPVQSAAAPVNFSSPSKYVGHTITHFYLITLLTNTVRRPCCISALTSP